MPKNDNQQEFDEETSNMKHNSQGAHAKDESVPSYSMDSSQAFKMRRVKSKLKLMSKSSLGVD